MRVFIGFAILIISISIFKWWGLLSLLIVLPFVGWKDRHKGPFFIPTDGVSNYEDGMRFHQKFPQSSRKLQDILVDLQNERIDDAQLKNDIYLLLDNLKSENFGAKEDTDSEILMGFVNKFSANFPNWKTEYSSIAKCIRSGFK